MAAPLFPSVLGTEFWTLDPCLMWVHSGESRNLRGTVNSDRMVSTLYRSGDLVVEQLGPAVLKFRLLVRDGALEWVLDPRRWRDRIYRLLARNRYRWFGRRSTCYLPR